MYIYEKAVFDIFIVRRWVSRVNCNLREKGKIDISDRFYNSRSVAAMNENVKYAYSLITDDKRCPTAKFSESFYPYYGSACNNYNFLKVYAKWVLLP